MGQPIASSPLRRADLHLPRLSARLSTSTFLPLLRRQHHLVLIVARISLMMMLVIHGSTLLRPLPSSLRPRMIEVPRNSSETDLARLISTLVIRHPGQLSKNGSHFLTSGILSRRQGHSQDRASRVIVIHTTHLRQDIPLGQLTFLDLRLMRITVRVVSSACVAAKTQ